MFGRMPMYFNPVRQATTFQPEETSTTPPPHHSLSQLAQKKQRQPTEYFSTGVWVMSLVFVSLFLTLSCYLWHHRHPGHPPRNTTLSSMGVDLNASRNASVDSLGADVVSALDFQRCNAGLTSPELGNVKADTTLLGKQCGEAEAASIAGALRAAGYKYEATLPAPYIYPGYLQQVLLSVSVPHRILALQHLQENAPSGSLGVLVKFFAWGLPVHEAHLRAALDSAAIASLERCQLLAPCTHLPKMTTSTAMIFPVPETSVLMATDWASKSTTGMTEEVVPIVSPEAMALVYNAPPAKGLNVLDFDSGSSVHGIVAAMRGAASTTLFVTNARAVRFARFSTWLNGLEGVVSIVQGSNTYSATSEGLLPEASFGLLLAQPPFLPVPTPEAAMKHRRNGGMDGQKALKDVLAAAKKVLYADGLLALVTDFSVPKLLPAAPGCHLGAPGFKGNLIVKKQPLPAQAYASAHASLASQVEQVGNLKLHGIGAVASGFMFARRMSEAGNAMTCGAMPLATLEDPLAWPTKTSKSDRPCKLSNVTVCPDGGAQESPLGLMGLASAS